MTKKFYVSVAEIQSQWNCSRSQAYKIIRQLNTRMLEMNPNYIVMAGKVNRKFYEENCYGLSEEE